MTMSLKMSDVFMGNTVDAVDSIEEVDTVDTVDAMNAAGAMDAVNIMDTGDAVDPGDTTGFSNLTLGFGGSPTAFINFEEDMDLQDSISSTGLDLSSDNNSPLIMQNRGNIANGQTHVTELQNPHISHLSQVKSINPSQVRYAC